MGPKVKKINAKSEIVSSIEFKAKKDVFEWFGVDTKKNSVKDSILVKVNGAYDKEGLPADSTVVVHTLTYGYNGKPNENNKQVTANGKYMIWDNTDVDGKYKAFFTRDCNDPLNNRCPKYFFEGIYRRSGVTPSGMKVYTRIVQELNVENFTIIDNIEE